jgi:hypothetical protein
MTAKIQSWDLALASWGARHVKFFRTAGITLLLAKTDFNSQRGTTG